MRYRNHKIVVWATLLAQLALGLGGPVEAFLCVGQDGHLEIEFGSTDCCDSQSIETIEVTCPAGMDNCHIDPVQNCGLCLDIPLFIAGQKHPVVTKQAQANVPDVSPVSLFNLSDSGHSATSNRYAADANPIKGTVDKLLRSTVLQI